MNNTRREAIGKVIAEIDNLLDDLSSHIQEIESEVESIREAEEEAYDNMPENLQNSDKGEAVMEAENNLSYAKSKLDDWVWDLRDTGQEIVRYLEEAKA